MKKLYDPIKPYNTFSLKVSDLHTIHVEEGGNKEGVPVIFVHGGPGGGTDEKCYRYFDPKKWRIILFDQRGCGKSKPFGELNENTTFDLVADMEKIREKLNISKWHVFGGSWGSTLSLAYAIKHPMKVMSLILRGIFLLRKEEIDWYYQKGANRLFPEEWEKYLEVIPENERNDLVKAYHKRLNSNEDEVVKKASKAWSRWEGATCKLLKDEDVVKHFSSDHFAYAFARIENHYFYNGGFFNSDNWILENAHVIKDIPGIIVQGRYDMPTPPISAYELSKCWPKAKLVMIEDAGHALSEKGISSALIEATDKFYRIGQNE